MKLSEVELGGRYVAKVSGRLQVVRVTELKEIPPASCALRANGRTLIAVVNENTGRQLTFCSAQRLRWKVQG